MPVNLKSIEDAYQKIEPFITKTPVITDDSLNQQLKSEFYFKCENEQKTGSFKIRGATNAVLRLSESHLKDGVITHSSGNHGGALAQAAHWKGIPCRVIVPHTAPFIKIRSMEEVGAIIHWCRPTLESRVAECEKIMNQTNAQLIHPFDNDHVIAGAGTIMLEMINQGYRPDFLFVPIGGGGCISGNAIAAKSLMPEIKVVGAEPELANDAYLSFKSGELHPAKKTTTIADGLRTALVPRTLSIIRTFVDQIITVSEEEIKKSVKFMKKRLNTVIEPSSATAVAAALKIRDQLQGTKVAVILTGGNVDINGF